MKLSVIIPAIIATLPLSGYAWKVSVNQDNPENYQGEAPSSCITFKEVVELGKPIEVTSGSFVVVFYESQTCSDGDGSSGLVPPDYSVQETFEFPVASFEVFASSE